MLAYADDIKSAISNMKEFNIVDKAWILLKKALRGKPRVREVPPLW